jgi:hypothetical protein
LTVEALEQVSEMQAVLRAEQSRRITENRLAHYRPYPKHREFHRAGAVHRERLLMAGNQLGKTTSGAAETAIHLTGRYPDWWDGRVLEGTIHALAGSESAELTRDGVQRLLVGPPRDESLWGTVMIPKEALADWSRKQGVPDALGWQGGEGRRRSDVGDALWRDDVALCGIDHSAPEAGQPPALCRPPRLDGMSEAQEGCVALRMDEVVAECMKARRPFRRRRKLAGLSLG